MIQQEIDELADQYVRETEDTRTFHGKYAEVRFERIAARIAALKAELKAL